MPLNVLCMSYEPGLFCFYNIGVYNTVIMPYVAYSYEDLNHFTACFVNAAFHY